LRVLINTIPLLSLITGVGKCTYYIAKTLREIDKENDYYYYYGYYSRKLKLLYNSFLIKSLNKFKGFIRATPFAPFLRRFRDSLVEFWKREFDLYLEPNYILLDKIQAKKKLVFVYDFSFDLYPEWHPKDRVLYFKENFWKRIKRADKIFLPSKFIYNEALNRYGFENLKLSVVHLGVDHEIFRKHQPELVEKVSQKYGLPENFILFVGSIEPRKNLKNLLIAYELLPQHVKKEYWLVLVGFNGWNNKEIMAFLNKNKERIVYIGYVSEKDLALIYNKTSIFIYPSLYEGFGLPPLEAMACGCPVIVSNRAGLPEVCGDAAYYIEPESPESIKHGILRILEDNSFREELSKKGLERAKLFTWEKTTKNLLEIFKEVLE